MPELVAFLITPEKDKVTSNPAFFPVNVTPAFFSLRTIRLSVETELKKMSGLVPALIEIESEDKLLRTPCASV